MELLRNKLVILIFIGIGLYSCAPPAPIVLDDDPFPCAWDQGGGGPCRAASVSGIDDGMPELRWIRRQKTALLLEPTLGNGILALPTANKKLSLVSPKSGSRVGEVSFKEHLIGPCIISDSLIVANEGGERLVVVNWVTGRRVWQVDLRFSEIEPLVISGRVLWQDGRRILYCYDLAEGKRIWDRKLGFTLAAAPTADSQAVVVISNNGQIEKLSLLDGTHIWSRKLPYLLRNASIIYDGSLICVSTGGQISKLDIRDGFTLWENDLRSQIIAPPAVDETGVYLGTLGGTLIKVDLGSGQKVWESLINGPIKAGAMIVGNMAVFVSLNHRAYFVDKNDGSIRYDYQAQGMLTARPVACGNRIYIAGEDRNLYCFQVSQNDTRNKADQP